MVENNRIKRTFLLILITVLLVNCKNAVEKSKENFEKNVDKELNANIKFFASTINFIYYANPDNYWYSEEYSYKDILNDKFNIGYRGLSELKEQAINISMATDEMELIKASEYLSDEITYELEEIKEKQNSMETVNSSMGFGFGGVSGLLDLGNALSSKKEREEFDRKNRAFPESILMAYSSLADISISQMHEMAEQINNVEKTLHKEYSPNENEKLIIRNDLQLFINGKIEKKYISSDKESFENMLKILWNYYEEKYENFDPYSPESYIAMSITQSAFQSQSIAFAEKIQAQFRERVGRKDRGVKMEHFLVLHQTTMPSVLIETGFLTNATENNYLKKTANKYEIQWQPEVLTGGGTDTAGVQRKGQNGSIAGALSIPTRHIHQSIEMSNIADIRATIDLLTQAVLEIDTYDWSFR